MKGIRLIFRNHILDVISFMETQKGRAVRGLNVRICPAGMRDDQRPERGVKRFNHAAKKIHKTSLRYDRTANRHR